MTELPPILDDIASLQEVLEQLPQGILIFLDLKLIFTNSAEAKMLGCEVSDLIGIGFEDTLKMIHPDDREIILTAAEAMQKDPNSTRYDRIRLVSRDGKITPIDNYGLHITIQGKDAVLIIAIDRSEQVSTEKALEESEETYKLLFDNAPVGLVITNHEGAFFAANKAFLQDTGYSLDEVLNAKASIMYENPKDREHFLSKLEKTGTLKDYEVTIKRKDGTAFPSLLNADPIIFQGKELFLTSIRNLSALKESQTTHRNIVRNIPIGLHMYEMKSDGKLVFSGANPAADNLLGVDNNQFVGKTIEDAFPPLADSEVPRAYKVAATKGIPWHTEQIEYADEKIAGAFEVHAFQTSPNKMAASFLDITNRLKSQLELERAKRRAEFYTDLMAHDLNNIHQGILVSLELIKNIQGLPARVIELADAALDQARRGIGLITNVRKLTSIEARDDIVVHAVDVRKKVEEIVPIIHFAFPDKKIEIKLNFPEDECIIAADELLGDVFYNLCHNSVKFGNMEKVRINIGAKPCEKDPFVEVFVEDYGPGIPDSRKEEVLNRRPGKTTTGLGLTLVSDIVRQYGGTIWIENRIPDDYTSGTRFVIRLPLYKGNS